MVVQSIPPPTPELSPATLVARVREVSYALPDARKGGNHQFQRRMQYERGANNAATLFGVDQIPSDQQIRNLLDPIPPESVFELFVEPAFLTHSILDHFDTLHHRVRQQLPSRRTFFEHLRALTQYVLFAAREDLFECMPEALQPAQPPPRHRTRR
ncbi:hypothetical protein Atep_09530 [Allochromatium tepidum]|uniref:Transposase n=1 Tax=Allochromatium tepidum TaxID=553982 RepID=A0ABM7QKM4_9GAMM|nr:hypothetical protein Atep_09530 [Allochromatium tepidum]